MTTRDYPEPEAKEGAIGIVREFRNWPQDVLDAIDPELFAQARAADERGGSSTIRRLRPAEQV